MAQRRSMGRLPDPSSLPRPWLGSYPPGVPPTYAYPDVPLTRFLDDAARDFPNVSALRFASATLTYAELLAHVDRFASALADLDVRAGVTLGLVLGNTPAYPVAAFAGWRLGATVVPLPPDLDDDELQRRLTVTRCETVVADATAVPRVNAVRSHLVHLRHLVAAGIEGWLPFPRDRLFRLTGRRSGRYRRLRAQDEALSLASLLDRSDAIARQAAVAPDDPAVVAYTSGTTGPPRPVLLTHANLVANSFQARLWVPDTQAGRERVLAALPLATPYGLTVGLLSAVLSAATIHLLDDPSPGSVLRAIDEEHPTLVPGTPTLFEALCEHPDVRKRDLTSVRACLSGDAPLDREVARRFQRLSGARLREGYGLTEAGPLTHANPIYGRQVEGRIGLPVTDTVATVVDVDDPSRVLGPGGVGHLLIHGPQVTPGYWRAEEGSAERPLRDGWLLTGDLAEMDADGWFRFVGRR